MIAERVAMVVSRAKATGSAFIVVNSGDVQEHNTEICRVYDRVCIILRPGACPGSTILKVVI